MDWDKVIQPSSSYLVLGDTDTGKSALAYWLLDKYSKQYGLLPVVAGLPLEKAKLLPANFVTKQEIEECKGIENAIILFDEAGLQLPLDNRKKSELVVNFLSLPYHRNQIFLLVYHYPRLVLARYLPFFQGFLLKRPPYLITFASKRHSDELTVMMKEAEAQFSQFAPDKMNSWTYVVAPKLRWRGMLENPLPSFWSAELRKVWAGVDFDNRSAPQPISDQAWLELKFSEVRAAAGRDGVQTGENLVCTHCGTKCQELYCEACKPCFVKWALSAKPKI